MVHRVTFNISAAFCTNLRIDEDIRNTKLSTIAISRARISRVWRALTPYGMERRKQQHKRTVPDHFPNIWYVYHKHAHLNHVNAGYDFQ